MTDQKHSYFYNEVGQVTFIFLANLNRFNLDSRRYMANAIFNAVYKPLERREGDLAQIDPESRQQLLDLATLDIMSKAFMALEDLGKVLLTVGRPLRELPMLMLAATQSNSLKAVARYAKKNEPELSSMFPFIDPAKYGLSQTETAEVERYYSRCTSVVKRMLVFLTAFIDRHEWAYNKYKHGIPIILALGGEKLADGIDGTVPILMNTKDPSMAKFVLTGPLVADKLIGLIGSVVDFSKMLVERRIQMAELEGLPPPVLCHMSEAGESITYTPWEFGHVDKAAEPILSSALTKSLQQVKRTRIQVTLNVNVDRQKVNDFANFYLKNWRIA